MTPAQMEDLRHVIDAAAELETRLATVLPLLKQHSQYQHVLQALRLDRDQLRKYAKRAAVHLPPDGAP